MIIDTNVAGIPCKAEVTYFVSVEPWAGSAHTCPSSHDYYGYTEVEFEILDRKGYKAEWLAKKLTSEDIARIEREIIEAKKETEFDYIY